MFALYFLNSSEQTLFYGARCFRVVVGSSPAATKLVAEATIFGLFTLALILKSFVSLKGSYGCSKG